MSDPQGDLRQALFGHALGALLPPPAWAPRLPRERFWPLLESLCWPDPVPSGSEEFEALCALIDDRATQLGYSASFANRVAFVASYRDLVAAFAAQLRGWRDGGTAVPLPAGESASELGAYAVLCGEDAYAAALVEPAAAARLAAHPGLLRHVEALLTFDDVMARSLDVASDGEVHAFLAAVAVWDTHDLPQGLTDRLVLHHPRRGPGVVTAVSGDPPQVQVQFADGEQTLRGAELSWGDPRRRFVEAALEILGDAGAAVDEARFFALVEPLGWGARSTDHRALAAALRASAPLRERIGAERRFWSLRRALQERIEGWERSSGRRLHCGDDSFGDLVSHIVGLGRAAYEEAMARPEVAFARAERRDYRESFAYVVMGAVHGAERGEVEALLREEAARSSAIRARLCEHPAHGLGLLRPGDDAVLGWEREWGG